MSSLNYILWHDMIRQIYVLITPLHAFSVVPLLRTFLDYTASFLSSQALSFIYYYLSLPMSVGSLSAFTIQHSFTIPNGPELGFDGNAKWEVFLDEVQQKVCGCSVTLCFYMKW